MMPGDSEDGAAAIARNTSVLRLLSRNVKSARRKEASRATSQLAGTSQKGVKWDEEWFDDDGPGTRSRPGSASAFVNSLHTVASFTAARYGKLSELDTHVSHALENKDKHQDLLAQTMEKMAKHNDRLRKEAERLRGLDKDWAARVIQMAWHMYKLRQKEERKRAARDRNPWMENVRRRRSNMGADPELEAGADAGGLSDPQGGRSQQGGRGSKWKKRFEGAGGDGAAGADGSDEEQSGSSEEEGEGADGDREAGDGEEGEGEGGLQSGSRTGSRKGSRGKAGSGTIKGKKGKKGKSGKAPGGSGAAGSGAGNGEAGEGGGEGTDGEGADGEGGEAAARGGEAGSGDAHGQGEDEGFASGEDGGSTEAALGAGAEGRGARGGGVDGSLAEGVEASGASRTGAAGAAGAAGSSEGGAAVAGSTSLRRLQGVGEGREALGSLSGWDSSTPRQGSSRSGARGFKLKPRAPGAGGAGEHGAGGDDASRPTTGRSGSSGVPRTKSIKQSANDAIAAAAAAAAARAARQGSCALGATALDDPGGFAGAGAAMGALMSQQRDARNIPSLLRVLDPVPFARTQGRAHSMAGNGLLSGSCRGASAAGGSLRPAANGRLPPRRSRSCYGGSTSDVPEWREAGERGGRGLGAERSMPELSEPGAEPGGRRRSGELEGPWSPTGQESGRGVMWAPEAGAAGAVSPARRAVLAPGEAVGSCAPGVQQGGTCAGGPPAGAAAPGAHEHTATSLAALGPLPDLDPAGLADYTDSQPPIAGDPSYSDSLATTGHAAPAPDRAGSRSLPASPPRNPPSPPVRPAIPGAAVLWHTELPYGLDVGDPHIGGYTLNVEAAPLWIKPQGAGGGGGAPRRSLDGLGSPLRAERSGLQGLSPERSTGRLTGPLCGEGSSGWWGAEPGGLQAERSARSAALAATASTGFIGGSTCSLAAGSPPSTWRYRRDAIREVYAAAQLDPAELVNRAMTPPKGVRGRAPAPAAGHGGRGAGVHGHRAHGHGGQGGGAAAAALHHPRAGGAVHKPLHTQHAHHVLEAGRQHVRHQAGEGEGEGAALGLAAPRSCDDLELQLTAGLRSVSVAAAQTEQQLRALREELTERLGQQEGGEGCQQGQQVEEDEEGEGHEQEQQPAEQPPEVASGASLGDGEAAVEELLPVREVREEELGLVLQAAKEAAARREQQEAEANRVSGANSLEEQVEQREQQEEKQLRPDPVTRSASMTSASAQVSAPPPLSRRLSGTHAASAAPSPSASPYPSAASPTMGASASAPSPQPPAAHSSGPRPTLHLPVLGPRSSPLPSPSYHAPAPPLASPSRMGAAAPPRPPGNGGAANPLSPSRLACSTLPSPGAGPSRRSIEVPMQHVGQEGEGAEEGGRQASRTRLAYGFGRRSPTASSNGRGDAQAQSPAATSRSNLRGTSQHALSHLGLSHAASAAPMDEYVEDLEPGPGAPSGTSTSAGAPSSGLPALGPGRPGSPSTPTTKPNGLPLWMPSPTGGVSRILRTHLQPNLGVASPKTHAAALARGQGYAVAPASVMSLERAGLYQDLICNPPSWLQRVGPSGGSSSTSIPAAPAMLPSPGVGGGGWAPDLPSPGAPPTAHVAAWAEGPESPVLGAASGRWEGHAPGGAGPAQPRYSRAGTGEGGGADGPEGGSGEFAVFCPSPPPAVDARRPPPPHRSDRHGPAKAAHSFSATSPGAAYAQLATSPGGGEPGALLLYAQGAGPAGYPAPHAPHPHSRAYSELQSLPHSRDDLELEQLLSSTWPGPGALDGPLTTSLPTVYSTAALGSTTGAPGSTRLVVRKPGGGPALKLPLVGMAASAAAQQALLQQQYRVSAGVAGPSQMLAAGRMQRYAAAQSPQASTDGLPPGAFNVLGPEGSRYSSMGAAWGAGGGGELVQEGSRVAAREGRAAEKWWAGKGLDGGGGQAGKPQAVRAGTGYL